MKCLIDLDGVLVDFMTGAHNFHGIPYSYENYPYELGKWDCLPPTTSSLSTEEFWDRLDENFWASLDWMPEGKQILAVVEDFFPKEDICILTTPTLNPSCTAGKIRWIQQNMPEYSRRYIVSPAKEFAASPSTLLIDDADHNIKKFSKAGGRTILIPRKWNSLHNKASSVDGLNPTLYFLFKELNNVE
jgi:5'(3')-deoxyribonucleotidase